MNLINRLSSCLLITAILLSLSGCGRNHGGLEIVSVSGRITYQGKPLANAAITFAPVSGARIATGTTDETGRYHLGTFAIRDGAVVGRHQVTVVACRPEKAVSKGLAYSGLPGGDFEFGEPLIPPKYFAAETSGLTAEVTRGRRNVFDFPLTD